MKLRSKIAVATLTFSAASATLAQMAYNVGLVSDYRYRGISQTALAPALQGGADYNHSSGFYVGTWASQIRWIEEAGVQNGVDTKGNVEHDIYGGYKGSITKDLSYDVGYLRYQYWDNTYKKIPGNVDPNTDEVYAALSYGAFVGKVSYAISNLFGYDKSAGSTYVDLAYTFDLGNGLSLVPHLGRQDISGDNSKYSYTDYALTISKDFGKGWSASLAAITTNGDTALYTVNGRKLADATVVAGLKFNF